MFILKAPFLLPGVFAFAGLGASLIAGSVWAQTAAVDPSPDQSVQVQAAQMPAPPIQAIPIQSGAVIAQPQAASAQSDSIDQQIEAWTQDPKSAQSANPNGGQPAPRQIHGEAGVAFGSSGYRSGYIATDIPIGKNSDLGIAVSETDFKPKHYGEVKDRSLAISLNIGGGANGVPVNCGSPTVPMDGRYLESAWVSRQHGEAFARDQASCGGPVAYRDPVNAGGAE